MCNSAGMSHQIAELLPQSAQDAAAGLADRGFADVQFGRDRIRWQSVDDGTPEGLPGPRFELMTDLFERAGRQVAEFDVGGRFVLGDSQRVDDRVQCIGVG